MRRKSFVDTSCIRIVDKPQVPSQCAQTMRMRRKRWIRMGRESRIHGAGLAQISTKWRRPGNEEEKQLKGSE
jgi:hypothetical protein